MDSIDIVFLVMVFGVGVIVGSFLNVVIYRLGSGAGFGGRSKCLSCGKILRPSMLIPLLSFLFQKGKCAYCSASLSWQYPLVELSTGGLFLLSALHNHLSLETLSLQTLLFFAFDACIWAILVLVTVYDAKHKIIPDILSVLFALFAGALLLMKYHYGIFPEQTIAIFDAIPWWIDLVAGPLLFAPFAVLWFLSGGRAMGLGDAKLSFGMGWFLGFSGGISAVIFGFWIAFFPSILLLFLRRKHFTMKSEIPFAPFLILGTLVVYVFQISILNWTF